jgi:hypothetical protein
MTQRACPKTIASVPGVLVMLACAILVAGCSTKMVYNHLDRVALWYISSSVSLDDEQETALQQSLHRVLAWHRRNELARYAKFLRDFASHAAAPLDMSTINEAGTQLEHFWHSVLAQAAPDGVKLLTSLRREQVDEFIGKLEKKDRERRDQALARSPQEQLEARERALTKQLTRWLGSLDDSQRAIAKRGAVSMPLENGAGYESRQAWRMQLREALLQPDNDDTGARDKALLALLEHPERTWTDAHRERNEEEKRRFIDMLLELDGTLSSEQRQTANRKLIDLAKQLEALQ